MAQIFVTRAIPKVGIEMLKEAGHEVDVSDKDGVLSKEELVTALSKKPYQAILCLLTDQIDAEVLAAAPQAKIVANYAVGYNNINLDDATATGVAVTNTPGVLTDTVAEYTVALILSVTKRVVEGDRFARAGKYQGWAPELLLGSDLAGKTLGILGAGRIGTEVATRMSAGFGMQVIYYDLNPNEQIEKIGCQYRNSVEEVLKEADVVSIHVPLLDSTRHLINRDTLGLMKATAYLINTSRGAVIDEDALATALQEGAIRGAGLDVFEFEPEINNTLKNLENVVLTPHIASASVETRDAMSSLAAENIITFFKGEKPPHLVKTNN